MKQYKVVVNKTAQDDFNRYVAYIRHVFNNPQAVKSLIQDFRDTKNRLATVAGSLAEPESEKLRSRGLKRLNFLRHNYFLLFLIDGDRAVITKIFHTLEDYENKLN